MKDNLISMSWFDYKKRINSLLEIFFTDIHERDTEMGHETIYSLWSDYACVRITRYEISGYSDKYLLKILDLSKFEQKVELLDQYICSNTIRGLSGDIYRAATLIYEQRYGAKDWIIWEKTYNSIMNNIKSSKVQWLINLGLPY